MSGHFRRVCLANFFVFLSVYMLFPVLPVAMLAKLDMSISETGNIFLFLILGRCLSGPFMNYLLDVFKRKYLCATAFVLTIVLFLSFFFVSNFYQLYFLSLLSGVSFGITTTALITLGIDITASDERSRGNIIFGYFTRSGVVLGVALGSFIYLNADVVHNQIASVIGVVSGLLLLLLSHIPFRAPIGTKLISSDRFLLLKTWPLTVSIILIAIVLGLIMPLVYFEPVALLMSDKYVIPYFVVVLIGFICTLFITKGSKSGLKTHLFAGLIPLVLSVISLMFLKVPAIKISSAILLGISLALITPASLVMFIELSSHCERATANSTNLLSWGVGISFGIALSCFLKDTYTTVIICQLALLLAMIALVCLLFFSFPYYLKKK